MSSSYHEPISSYSSRATPSRYSSVERLNSSRPDLTSYGRGSSVTHSYKPSSSYLDSTPKRSTSYASGLSSGTSYHSPFSASSGAASSYSARSRHYGPLTTSTADRTSYSTHYSPVSRASRRDYEPSISYSTSTFVPSSVRKSSLDTAIPPGSVRKSSLDTTTVSGSVRKTSLDTTTAKLPKAKRVHTESEEDQLGSKDLDPTSSGVMKSASFSSRRSPGPKKQLSIPETTDTIFNELYSRYVTRNSLEPEEKVEQNKEEAEESEEEYSAEEVSLTEEIKEVRKIPEMAGSEQKETTAPTPIETVPIPTTELEETKCDPAINHMKDQTAVSVELKECSADKETSESQPIMINQSSEDRSLELEQNDSTATEAKPHYGVELAETGKPRSMPPEEDNVASASESKIPMEIPSSPPVQAKRELIVPEETTSTPFRQEATMWDVVEDEQHMSIPPKPAKMSQGTEHEKLLEKAPAPSPNSKQTELTPKTVISESSKPQTDRGHVQDGAKDRSHSPPPHKTCPEPESRKPVDKALSPSPISKQSELTYSKPLEAITTMGNEPAAEDKSTSVETATIIYEKSDEDSHLKRVSPVTTKESSPIPRMPLSPDSAAAKPLEKDKQKVQPSEKPVSPVPSQDSISSSKSPSQGEVRKLSSGSQVLVSSQKAETVSSTLEMPTLKPIPKPDMDSAMDTKESQSPATEITAELSNKPVGQRKQVIDSASIETKIQAAKVEKYCAILKAEVAQKGPAELMPENPIMVLVQTPTPVPGDRSEGNYFTFDVQKESVESGNDTDSSERESNYSKKNSLMPAYKIQIEPDSESECDSAASDIFPTSQRKGSTVSTLSMPISKY